MRRQWKQVPPTAGPSIIGKGPAANLAARRAAGEVHPDPVQEKVVLRLQAVYDQFVAMAAITRRKPGLLARLGLGARRQAARRARAGFTSGDRSAAASRC